MRVTHIGAVFRCWASLMKLDHSGYLAAAQAAASSFVVCSPVASGSRARQIVITTYP